MTDQEGDRFDRVDKALDRVREEFNEAVEDSKAAGGKAAKEVREAIDTLENRVSKVRERDEK